MLTVATMNRNTHLIVGQSSAEKDKGNEHWWRPLEAAFTALGSVSSSILEIVQDEQAAGRPANFDISTLLTGIVPSLLTLPRK